MSQNEGKFGVAFFNTNSEPTQRESLSQVVVFNQTSDSIPVTYKKFNLWLK